MIRADHLAVARDAAAKARAGTITYQQQDCQSFVEGCVRAAGGRMDYAGSNDMFRHTVPVCEIKNGKPLGTLLPGDLLFIHAFDGGEPSKYKSDGMGNASHVGLYCGVDGVEVAHSSYTKQRVCESTLKNGWTHARRAKEIDYGGYISIGIGGNGMGLAGKTCKAMKQLNMRAKASKDSALVCRVPSGKNVLCLSEGAEYSQTRYEGVCDSTGKDDVYTGYLLTEGLAEVEIDGDAGGGSAVASTGAQGEKLIRLPSDVWAAVLVAFSNPMV